MKEVPSKSKVLYLDDEQENLDGFYYSLMDEFEVFITKDYNEAQEILSNNEIEVMVVDQKMPDISGIEIIKEQKRLYPSITFILITAFASLVDALKAVNEAGIFRFISKPWSDELIRKSLFEAVEFYRIKQENKNLLKELQEQNEKLKKAFEEVKQSNKLKTAFLANISHEIRTPLNAIVGFSNLLVESDLGKEKQKDFHDLIVRNSDDLLAMIDQIVNVSKIETNQQKFYKTEFALKDIFNELNKFSSNASKEVEFINDIDDQLKEHLLYTDLRHLNIVFECLINNAFKFTKNGFVMIGASMETQDSLKQKGIVPINDLFDGKQEHLFFFVKDTGRGIHSDFHTKIFEPFRKISDDTGEVIGGVGMGLYHASKIINSLFGEMFVFSEPCEGASFYFYINEGIQE